MLMLCDLALDIMAVDPTYHRRGVGSLLVQWGLNIADKLGLEVGLRSKPILGCDGVLFLR